MSLQTSSQMAVDSVVRNMVKNHKPKINVVGLDPMKNASSYIRVTASVTSTGKTSKEPSQIPVLIAEHLGSKLRPVMRSFSVLASNNIGATITGIFTLNPESIAYESGMEGYRALSGNMFIDDEESLWVLRKTDGGKILVKSTGMEDADIIADLMPSVSSVGIGTMAFEATASIEQDNSIRASLEGGDFITYVNPDKEAVDFGVIIASVEMDDGSHTDQLVVQSSDEDAEHQIIDRGMVVAHIEGVDVGDMEISESAAQKSLAEIAAYYKQMFVRDPVYYEKFMQRFQNHIFA